MKIKKIEVGKTYVYNDWGKIELVEVVEIEIDGICWVRNFHDEYFWAFNQELEEV